MSILGNEFRYGDLSLSFLLKSKLLGVVDWGEMKPLILGFYDTGGSEQGLEKVAP